MKDPWLIVVLAQRVLDAHATLRDRAAVSPAIRVALACSAMIAAAAIGIALSRSPAVVVRVSSVQHVPIERTRDRLSACQSGEVLPRDTTAIRLRVFAFLGPRVVIRVLERGRTIAQGTRGSGWTGGVVTVPLRVRPATVSGTDVCFTLFLNGDETAELVGERTASALAARTAAGPLPGRVRIEYLRPGPSSWWSLAPSVARRMGLGHAWSGAWSAILVAALMGAVAILCLRLALRGLE